MPQKYHCNGMAQSYFAELHKVISYSKQLLDRISRNSCCMILHSLNHWMLFKLQICYLKTVNLSAFELAHVDRTQHDSRSKASRGLLSSKATTSCNLNWMEDCTALYFGSKIAHYGIPYESTRTNKPETQDIGKIYNVFFVARQLMNCADADSNMLMPVDECVDHFVCHVFVSRLHLAALPST